mmetsp:Transcript_1392/g.3211  ORF Transcript_1392/g.3211 Transcript_1392/m.3211 type:complete len:410 (+) Transcript_1392:518-1747(+)
MARVRSAPAIPPASPKSSISATSSLVYVSASSNSPRSVNALPRYESACMRKSAALGEGGECPARVALASNARLRSGTARAQLRSPPSLTSFSPMMHPRFPTIPGRPRAWSRSRSLVVHVVASGRRPKMESTASSEFHVTSWASVGTGTSAAKMASASSRRDTALFPSCPCPAGASTNATDRCCRAMARMSGLTPGAGSAAYISSTRSTAPAQSWARARALNRASTTGAPSAAVMPHGIPHACPACPHACPPLGADAPSRRKQLSPVQVHLRGRTVVGGRIRRIASSLSSKSSFLTSVTMAVCKLREVCSSSQGTFPLTYTMMGGLPPMGGPRQPTREPILAETWIAPHSTSGPRKAASWQSMNPTPWPWAVVSVRRAVVPQQELSLLMLVSSSKPPWSEGQQVPSPVFL